MQIKFNINYSNGTVKEHFTTINSKELKKTSFNQMVARAWMDLCLNFLYVYLEKDVTVKTIEFVGKVI